jgi:predicted CXXCH cytochrome family protein
MPSSFREPKSLSEALQLDYYRRPRGLRRLRSWLGWTTLAATAALALLTVWPRARFVYQALPVSPAHALFDNNCEVCHKKSFVPASRLINSNATLTSVDDTTCLQCHDGPPHQPAAALSDADTPRCASCHPEHRGKAAMARVSDDRCSTCHKQLTRSDGKPSQFAAMVTRFIGDLHPDFRKREGTGSKISFNHKLHLGLSQHPNLAEMSGALEALGAKGCQYCHATDSAGAYMKPIIYEEHCKVCHPLKVFLFDEPRTAPVQAFNRERAPHREPAVVRENLRSRLVDFIEHNPIAAPAPETTLNLPPFSPLPETADDKGDWVQRQQGANERLLFDGAIGCRYCHSAERRYDFQTRGLPQFAKSGIRDRWMEHSNFSHRSHQLLECTQCHDALDSDWNQAVSMPGKAVCLECHQKNLYRWQEQRVRSDCVDCHYYHKHSGQDFKGTFTISDCTRQR